MPALPTFPKVLVHKPMFRLPKFLLRQFQQLQEVRCNLHNVFHLRAFCPGFSRTRLSHSESTVRQLQERDSDNLNKREYFPIHKSMLLSYFFSAKIRGCKDFSLNNCKVLSGQLTFHFLQLYSGCGSKKPE
ncbi:hypothetical protein D3C80_1621130 [compost metagenome]